MLIGTERPALGFASDAIDAASYSWTLASRFGEMLEEVEKQFGARDLLWTILGIEFGPQEYPQLWYPGRRRQVLIMLSEKARMDPRRALFQLAGMVVHLLAPTGGDKAPVIEIGTSTLYSHTVSAVHDLNFGASGARVAAERLVIKLLTLQADAIKALRAKQPLFLKITPDHLMALDCGVTPELAATLCEPFSAFEARHDASRVPPTP